MPSLQFIPILSLLVIVSFTSLAYVEFPSAFAQTEVQENTTKTTIPELERMTFRVYFDGNDCTIPEKFDVIPLSKCEMTDGKPHMTVSVLPEHVIEMMFKNYSEISPAKGYFKTDLTTFYKTLEHLIQKNNVINERALGNVVQDVEDKLVRVILYMEKGQCDFPRELNVKLIDTDCKPMEDYYQYPYQIAVDVPILKLLELEKLDYVKKINDDYTRDSDFIEPDPVNFVLPDNDLSSSESKLVTSSEPDNEKYSFLVFVIVPVSVTVILFLCIRKRKKIKV